MSKEIGDEYTSSLSDLTMNSKPLINMLTILAEENIDHAAVIVQSVEKHLDKVHPDIKLPVLYLVDSIIKNVGGDYTTLFTQIIVGMFCRVFKQVDEKTRSQMFKLRDTWHDVFPSIKLYQLDVKVNLIDPAWPIQAQPPQSNIHVNPNFLMKNNAGATVATMPTTSVVNPAAQMKITTEDEEMLNAVAMKEQELLLLQKRKIELKLEQATKRLEINKPGIPIDDTYPVTVPSAVVAVSSKLKKPINMVNPTNVPGSIRIAPVSAVLLNNSRRKDPRLARNNPDTLVLDGHPMQSNQFVDAKKKFSRPSDINDSLNKDDNKSNNRQISLKKDLSIIRHKNVESNKQSNKPASLTSKRIRSPIKNNSNDSRFSDKRKKQSNSPPRPNKLPPIPKLKSRALDADSTADSTLSKSRKDGSSRSNRNRKFKLNESEHNKRSRSPYETKKVKLKPLKYDAMDIDSPEQLLPVTGDVTFKELKTSTKERNYIRRNREKSESPEKLDIQPLRTSNIAEDKSGNTLGNGVAKRDVDLRVIAKVTDGGGSVKKRPSSDSGSNSPAKKNKTEKLDTLFGDEDVDLRKLPIAENLTPPPPLITKETVDAKLLTLDIKKDLDGWSKIKEIQSPGTPGGNKSHLALVRAKLAEATKSKDPLGRPFLYSFSEDDGDIEDSSVVNSEDTDMRQQALGEMENESVDSTIKTILSQAEENLKNGEMNKTQYNFLLRQVLHISEAQKLKEAQQKESLEMSKRKLKSVQMRRFKPAATAEKNHSDEDDVHASYSPQYDDMEGASRSPSSNFVGGYGDIDERVAPLNVPEKRPPLLPRPPTDMSHMDSDLRMYPQGFDKHERFPRGERFGGRYGNARMHGGKGWRGMRSRAEERAMFRSMGRGGLLPPPPQSMGNRRGPRFDIPRDMPYGNKGPQVGVRQINCPVLPYNREVTPPPMGTSSIVCPMICPNAKVLEYIEQDSMKTIQIDGTAREIRYYDKTAVIMLNWDDPRDISFEAGHRRVYFDDESFVLKLNEDYLNVTIDGQPHSIRFGGPTRELFIDDRWFECFFGGPPMPIFLDNKLKYLKLEGPPPQVSIGKTKRTDLVAGKINLIIDATEMCPIFLDAKVQKFEIEGVSHTVRFVDSLQTILVNENPFKVEFGGLPKPIVIGKKKHFIRFSVLPQGVKAGQVNIKDMEGKKPIILPIPVDANISSGVIPSTLNSFNMDTGVNSLTQMPPTHDINKTPSDMSGGLDMLASVLPSSMAPASQFSGYSVLTGSMENSSGLNAIPGLEQVKEPASNISAILQNVNVNDLFAKLVASGIVTTLPTVASEPKTETQEAPSKVPEKVIAKDPTTVMKPVDLLKSETLKNRQPGLIGLLHTGMQCGSCGVRFPPEHTVRYSQHLDWHFRQNRADRHSQRRPNSRRWYYDISDWIQYQEIEDLEEREKSWFEREQQAAEAARTEEAAAVAARRETSSVPLKSGAPPELLRCHLCHDSFHQFYNHDTDEWHLRNSIEHEGNNYHPVCLDDHKAALVKEQEPEEPEEENKTLIELDKDLPDQEDTNVEPESPAKIEEPVDEENTQENDNVGEDNEEEEESSVVEVLSEENATRGSLIEETPDADVELLEDDDDVVIKNEPVEQIVVEDADTDEETEKERHERDTRYLSELPVDFANVKIKQEPIDPDDEPIITSEGTITAQADTTHAAVLSSIDGNVQLEPTTNSTPVVPSGGIKINISKPIAVIVAPPPVITTAPKEKEVSRVMFSADDSQEPFPPGEEPEIFYKLKPSLEGINLAVQPPTQRGSELSGLCSIM